MAAMTSRPDVSRFDQRVVLHGKTWADYDAQLAIRGFEGRRPKLAFLEGALELMSPSKDHERIKWHLGRVLELYCTEVGIPISGIGEWTIRDESEEAGLEPDECYFVGQDFNKPRPDLAIEVVWTHGGIAKLEIYRRLGVSEVWFWDDDKIEVHRLGPEGYARQARSSLAPDLDLDELARIANGPRRSTIDLHREVRARLIPQP
jgi:Uma2 family endonuclease